MKLTQFSIGAITIGLLMTNALNSEARAADTCTVQNSSAYTETNITFSPTKLNYAGDGVALGACYQVRPSEIKEITLEVPLSRNRILNFAADTGRSSTGSMNRREITFAADGVGPHTLAPGYSATYINERRATLRINVAEYSSYFLTQMNTGTLVPFLGFGVSLANGTRREEFFIYLIVTNSPVSATPTITTTTNTGNIPQNPAPAQNSPTSSTVQPRAPSTAQNIMQEPVNTRSTLLMERSESLVQKRAAAALKSLATKVKKKYAQINILSAIYVSSGGISQDIMNGYLNEAKNAFDARGTSKAELENSLDKLTIIHKAMLKKN